jgi:arylsulfatase
MPFRCYKQYIHEGSIASSQIVQWPEKIKKARLVPDAAHIIYIMPTFLEIVGALYPSGYKGNPLLPMDGKSLMPLISNCP